MDFLPKDSILEFNDNTLVCVRKELNLTKLDINTMINNFEEWIQKQNHFTKKNFDRQYLEISIIAAKGSLERAKKALEKLCTLKTLLPIHFSKYNVKELEDTMDYVHQALMPSQLKGFYRLYVMKFLSSDYEAKYVMDFHAFSSLSAEYLKANDYTLGVKIIVDGRDINILSILSKYNAIDLRDSLTIMTEGYGFRVAAIHLLSNSSMIDAAVTFLKQVLSAKIGNRIHVHHNVESLYEYFDKDVLPKEYGGDQMPLKEIQEKWIQVLSEEENVYFMKDIMCNAGTDEKRRITLNYNEQVLGMPGSFRLLTVD